MTDIRDELWAWFEGAEPDVHLRRSDRWRECHEIVLSPEQYDRYAQIAREAGVRGQIYYQGIPVRRGEQTPRLEDVIA